MTALNPSNFRFGRPRRQRGFTLIELMVVIGIIVMMLALAVPLINALRGGRSVDAGQNIVSATLQRARARAIWLQERRGIFFFDDQTTGKTAMLMVKVLDGTPGTLELDEENQELEYLPVGVGAAFVAPDNNSAAATSLTYHPYGLVVFDGLGRTDTILYKLAFNPQTALLQQYGTNIDGNLIPSVSSTLGTGAKGEQSEIAMVLYDRRLLADQGAPASSVQFSTLQTTWLDSNALALVVNRYNGTLLRGE
jgi:prepilin-type N-terminal cleavage/methylation domain-containing protein